MKTLLHLSRVGLLSASIANLVAFCSHGLAQSLADGLVAYWPLDAVVGDKTPDLVSGYDLSPYFGAGHTLTNGSAIALVPGYRSNAVSFVNANQTLLAYLPQPTDDLPINKHAALTVSLWVNGPANQTDRRVFSEANVNNNNPLFNIGTPNNGSGGTVDLFFRQQPTQAEMDMGFGNFGGGTHLLSGATAFDDTWHHVTLVQQEDGSRTLYIDGVADSLVIPAKPAGNWNVNATSVGGILRLTAVSWVTALIDDVAVWKRALTQEEITELNMNGLNSVFPPLANGLVSHWPLDAVVGDKMPDLVSAHDLSPYFGAAHTLTNGNAIALVPGYRSNAVSFVNANQTLLAYLPQPTDDLPINKHAALTVSLWVNGPANQTDRRVFSEANVNNNNPLFNIGTPNNGSGGTVDLFFRQQPTQAEMDMGFGNFGGGTHLLSGATAFDDTWHHIALVQQEDGTRTLYIDGVADGLVIPAKPAGNWNVNATSVGGILRLTAVSWVTALIDDVAVWKRALSQEEIDDARLNGVPKVFTRKLPLQIRTFAADRPTVVQGDSVVLSWEASADASLTLSPPLVDVTAQSPFGVGSTSLVVNATTTYTLTASRGAESTNQQTTVNAVSGVAPGWRLIEHFDLLNLGHIGMQGNWQNALSSISGAHNPANVQQAVGNNQYLGFDGATVLAGNALASMTMAEGTSNTLFFRFYLAPNVDLALPGVGVISEIDINVGLTDKGLRDIQDFRGGNNGPSVRIFRQGGGLGGPIDLRSPNGVNAAAGTYSWLTDAVNNPTGAGLEVGKVYDVWIDVQNRPFDVVMGVQNGGDLYSLYLQKEGDPARLNLFTGYVADRDAINCDPILGCPVTSLTHLFLAANDQVTPQGTNLVRFDDFFLSTSGYNSTIPIPPSSFQEPIRVIQFTYDGFFNFTLTWTAVPGQTYTVEKRASLSSGAWEEVVTDFPAGGATEATVTYTDMDATGGSLFYRISNP
jgi:hypothetical protein